MDEKLKVLQAIDVFLPDVDGVISCVHNYGTNMQGKAECTVAAPKNKRGYKDELPYSVVRCNSVFVPILNDHYGFPSCDKKFKKQIDKGDFDIIHVHSPFNMARFALKAAKKKNIPVVATFHSDMRTIFKSVVKLPFVAEMMVKSLGRLYNKFDEVFVCSEPVKKQLLSYGYKGKVTFLPFGTDFEKCRKVEELAKMGESVFGIEPKTLVFVYIGRIMKLKRIDFILDALKIVKDRGLKFKFYAVGKGAELKKLTAYAEKLGFNDDEVVFTGFLPREHFPYLSARADLLLFPSLYDNFGLVKVECASYATAGLFVENSCAGADIIDGENGYLSADDVNAFADKIMEASADYDRLKTVGRRAQETLYIHWSECTDRLLETYKRIISERSSKVNGGNDNQK